MHLGEKLIFLQRKMQFDFRYGMQNNRDWVHEKSTIFLNYRWMTTHFYCSLFYVKFWYFEKATEFNYVTFSECLNFIKLCNFKFIFEALDIQGVPSICWQLQTKFWKLKNHMSKSKPCFKILGKKLLDGTLKPGKIKLEVFLNWI